MRVKIQERRAGGVGFELTLGDATFEALLLAERDYLPEQILSGKQPTNGYFVDEARCIMPVCRIIQRVSPLQNKRGHRMELIAEEIEDSFGTGSNDLPTDRMSANIRKAVAELL